LGQQTMTNLIDNDVISHIPQNHVT